MEIYYSAVERVQGFGHSIVAESTNIHYGQDKQAGQIFDEILKIKDVEERRKAVDKLVDSLEQNADKDNPQQGNGFYSKDQIIYIQNGGFNKLGPQFVIDDREIYYQYVETCIKLMEKHPDASLDLIKYNAIKITINSYFGHFNGDKNHLRDDLLLPGMEFDGENDVFVTKSIKAIKGKGIAQCVERASIAQNLLIMSGKKSFCIESTVDFTDAGYQDEAHKFCIIQEQDGSYRIFDVAYDLFGKFRPEDKPIDDLLAGKSLELHDKEKHKLIYGNVDLEKRREK